MTKDDLIQVLSEAAVEIENNCGPNNIVAHRVRRTSATLKDGRTWDRWLREHRNSFGDVPEKASAT